ncbi:MAG: hypothetical protein U0I51_06135 [Muricomes sp.]|uniref:hypothetical protein n=1 Tax=Faecalicatena contorta TaxID=39482 RepID=UPI002E9E31B2|nr:hypothetical protein [Muricomes sp.]
MNAAGAGAVNMHLKWNSTIKKRFFFFSTINIIIIIFMIAVILNILFEKTITDKAKVFQKREVSLVSNNLELLVNSINDYILTLSVDNSLQDVLRKYDDIPDGEEEQYNVKLQLTRAVYSKSALNSYIDSVAVISKAGKFFDIGTYPEENLMEIVSETGMDIENLQNKTVWYGPVKMENDFGKTSDVFVIAKPVVDIWSPTTLGYVFVTIKESKVSNFYNNLTEKKYGAICNK